METKDIINQVIGAIGYLLLANSYFNKSKAGLLAVQIVSNIFLTIHFYLLSGIAGAICNVVCLISDIVIFICDKKQVKKKTLIAIVLIALLFISSFATLHLTGTVFTYKEAFPIFATSIIILSLISDSKSFIRIVGLLAAICWLVYGIIFHSFAGIVFETIIIISTILAFIKGKGQ